MSRVSPVIRDLATYGPSLSRQPVVSSSAARDYCRRLALTHYENFSVASLFLPRDLRQHFCNIYAYCRWSDDLADEAATSQQSLELLAWWQAELQNAFRDEVRHPVFVALQETICEFSLPIAPFENLLIAFRQDQTKTRYANFDELLGYCRNSANPVGELILYLGRCHNSQNVAWSDSICTGLQLANFCQDVARDAARGRIYLPQDSWRRFDYGEPEFAAQICNQHFRDLLRFETDRAAEFLRAGEPLLAHVPRWLRRDLSLFVRGGLAIIAAIRSQDYDVWSRRPVVGKWAKLKLLASTLWS